MNHIKIYIVILIYTERYNLFSTFCIQTVMLCYAICTVIHFLSFESLCSFVIYVQMKYLSKNI